MGIIILIIIPMYPFYGDISHVGIYSMGELYPHTVGTGGK